MKLTLIREIFTEKTTIGSLFVDDKFECYTLEDVVRLEGEKVYGQTAISAGTYEVIIDLSNRFKIELPRLLNVPMFEGIRIHPGNKAEDTDGCILVGVTKSKNWVGQSKIAFNRLFDKMEKAYQLKEPITIEIKNGER
jgi:hypothetical protein